jgi:hypothetical protein
MAKPRIITASEQGLRFQNVFGQLGAERYVTVHHTAGPQDDSLAEAKRLCAQYHRDHAAKGWGGIGYHYCITRGGVILGLRPTLLLGAHVGGWNTGNVGTMFHGTTGNRAKSPEQIESFRWLLHNAHTRAMPKAHRVDVALTKKAGNRRRGHHDWPGHETNACPGTIGESIFKEISR